MRKRLFSEIDTPKPAAGMPPDPTIPAFLLIEANHINVILHCHNVHGMLIDDIVHPTIDAAREDAAHRFGNRLGNWTRVPPELPSLTAILAERRRQLIASGIRVDLTLDYRRRRIQFDQGYWWEGFLVYSGMQAALLLAFGLIFVHGRPLLYYALTANGGLGFLTTGLTAALIQIVLYCMLLSSVLWTFPRAHAILTGMALFVLGSTLLLLLTFGMYGTSTGEKALAWVSVIPFVLVAIWRFIQNAHRCIVEE